MDKNFFAYISRMKHINRWSLMRNSFTENLAEHSMMTAAIAHCLALINNIIFNGNVNPDKLAVRGIYHDAVEVLIGDLPTPIKYHSLKLNGIYQELENNAAATLLEMLPEKLQEKYVELIKQENVSYEHRLLKAADKICAFIKCVEEVNSGNNEFKKALMSVREEISGYNLPEVDYFMSTFEKSFGKTLDELN